MTSVKETLKRAELKKSDILLVSRYCNVRQSPLYKNGDYDT